MTPMWKETHTMQEWIEHLWPYITGMFLILTATVKLWFYDRNETRKLINDNHEVVLKEMRKMRDDNHNKHTEIMQGLTDQMINLFKKK